MAVAIAAALIVQEGKSARILEEVPDFLPDSDTRTMIKKASSLPCSYSIPTIISALGNGSKLTAQDTVPFALWSAQKNLDNYEEAIWNTISALGDLDTNCAIVGSLVILADKGSSLPKNWLEARESLSNFE